MNSIEMIERKQHIFSYNIGGSSVSHHLLNDESIKYFQQALVMSGTAQTYSQYLTGNHLCLMNVFAKKYSKWMGDSLEELIELLKYIPEQEILDFASEIENYPRDVLEFEVLPTFNVMWWPIIEAENAIQPFLLDDPGMKLENKANFNITSYFTSTNRVCRNEFGILII